jgi:hypothetical protein
MPLAEGVSARVSYKFNTSGVISPGPGPDPTVDPGTSGGQILRRVATTIAMGKDTYQSNEIRSDRQIADFRHGVHRVTGNIQGELSPLTYRDLFEASFRSTWTVAPTGLPADFTSVAADSTTSTFTFASGDPVAKGFRVGQGIQFTLLSAPTNNAQNYVITSFSGTTNQVVHVFPPPTTMAADTTFTVAATGRSVWVPSTGFVSRKCALEVFNSDVDVARLFTECRVGGFDVKLPASGMSTIQFEFTGRDMTAYDATTTPVAPFFTAPLPVTTTGLLAAVNGLLQVGGTTVAVVTALDIKHTITLTAEPVVGSNLVPEIFMGRTNVTGQLTAFFQDVTLINDFKNESEISIMAFLTTTSAPSSPAMSFYLPRVKLGGADLQTTGEGGQMITLPFQALKYQATPVGTGGIENTTIVVWDSEVDT